MDKNIVDRVKKTDKDWKKELTSDQYHVCREAGTEAPFSGEYVDMKENGIYHCVACGNLLFSSATKFESGTGWPSFWDVVDKGNVELRDDNSLGMHRVEAVCKKCQGHLGHVFNDGPKDKTGMRYCINSVALKFNPQKS